MLRTRVAAVMFGAALAVGGAATAAVADSGSSPPGGSSETETQLPATGGPVTVTVAGVGTVTFTVDATGAISNLVITPIDGVTVGTPTVTEEGVKVQVTAADGTIRVLEIAAKHDDGGIEVETEIDVEDPQGSGGSGDHHDGQGSGPHGDHHGDSRSGPSADQSGGDHSGGGDTTGGDHSGSGDHGGTSGGKD